MADTVFDREKILDISVNLVPLFIIAFFFVLYTVGSQYPQKPLISTISLALLVVPFFLLALLTYFAAHYI